MRKEIILLLSLIPFISKLLGLNVVLASGQCPENQKTSLLELRNNLTYDSSVSIKLVHWDESSDCCHWPGVSCDNSGHIIGLDLNSESISDTIYDWSSLFSLEFLQSLNLAENRFDAVELPSNFEKLAQLTYLNLSNSGFGGQIPKEFSRLTRLVTLDLSISDLSPSTVLLQLENPNLEMLVKNLSKLREIYLDGVNISANGYDWSQGMSSSLPDLNVLSLSNCYLSDPPHSSLTKLQNLSVIHLDGNPFSTRFPDFFADFSHLTVLTLSSCDLFGTIPQTLFQIPTLRTLDLSYNYEIEGSFPDFLPNGSLQNLVLSVTSISGNLPGSISDLKALSRVDLNACNFSGGIPSSMANLTQLVYLDLSQNHFSGPIPSFSQSKNLTVLNLYHNDLTGEIPSSLWEGLDRLTSLDLSNNSFSGHIPASLFSLPSLQDLRLSNNNFSGKISELPDVSSRRLEFLEMSGNHLEGPIPQFFFGFHNLRSLSLSNNRLSGITDLTNFIKFRNLSTLELSNNNLSVVVSDPDGSALSLLPQFGILMLASCNLQRVPPLRNQSKLMMLDLSNNQITGQIPNWMSDVGDGFLRFLNLSHNKLTHLQEPFRFPNLHFLDLHSNLLDGEIPLPPLSAAYVDFSTNNFRSSIPIDMGNHLSFTYFFSIANNEVTGNIPLSLCNASKLEVLDLSNNSLLGTIPSCLMEGSKILKVMNLRRNNLSGNIPKISLQSCEVETLDLSWNQLEGQVPETLSNCTNLKVLNLGNNQIADTFPCWLTNLSKLRVIVLRFNSFKGNVSCIRDSYTWTNLQIIDLASNNFSGVVPLEASSNWKAMMVDRKKTNSQLDHLRFRSFAVNKIYYQDSATVVLKGQELELEKILTLFTSIDFSSNHFQGSIPDIIGDLNLLYLLNLSHNDLTGPVPSSIGNLQQLGSLDLSFNKLDGEIPKEIGNLTFLLFLNLSYNHLFGRIPEGNQIRTFPESSFTGNEGLCGLPLNRTCNIAGGPEPPQPAVEENLKTDIYVSAALGFAVGLGVIFMPLFYSRRYKMFYNKNIDWLVSKILHQQHRKQRK